jgi:hypothetical protein
MAYRDERDALRAKVEHLERELEEAKEAEVVLFPKKTPQQKRLRALIAGGALVVAAGAGIGAWQWTKRLGEQDVRAAWGHLSTCLVGDPLAPSESASQRVRRIQLAYVGAARGADGHWPSRCQAPAHQLYQKLRENGQAEQGKKDAAYWAETIAAKIEHGAGDDEVLAMIEPLFVQAREAGLVAAPTAGDTAPPAPANPLHLADLAGSAVTNVEIPAASLYTEMLPGIDRHVLLDDPRAEASLLCSLSAQSDAITCRPLPGDLGKKHGLRLIGTTDAGAAPLVFSGREGADGIYRSDTGELVASVRAHSGYSAADGYVAIQTWPDTKDGSFEIIEQSKSGAEIKRTTVKPDAQREIKPVTTIHRSRLLWDKAILQLLDSKNLDSSPWVAFKTLGKESVSGAFHRVGDLNWINTTIMGCRGARGMVARFGPSDAMLLFNEGERWQGPLPARGLGEIMRCDGADAVFLSSWPVRVKRCTPAGCDEQTPEGGAWPTQPVKGTSTVAYDLVDGKALVVWATERHGVRFRVGSAAQIGKTSDVVVFDDFVGAKGEAVQASVISGLRVVAAGRAAMLFVATGEGIRAIRVGADGSFGPAKITR